MKLLSTLFLILSTFLTFSFGNGYTERLQRELNNLSDEQILVLANSLWHGKDHDLSIWLAATAWKESNFGKYKVNATDGKYGSYGSHMILLDTAFKVSGINPKKDKFKVWMLKNSLLNLETVSIFYAVNELEYWLKRHKGNFDKAVASYNAGNKGINSDAGKRYLADIKLRMKYIKKYVEARGLKFKDKYNAIS